MSPSAYAQRAAELVAEGATLLSGEDMVTPEHVRAVLDHLPIARWEARRSVFPTQGIARGLSNVPPRI
jgi:hypothetical protein